MAKFKKSSSKETPPISTSSLPDIIFMLLFFFMVSTTMRQQDLKIMVHVPGAVQIQKLEKKSLVSYIYVGSPTTRFQKMFGTEPRIQLNDAFATTGDIRDYITSEREARDEKEVPYMTTSLKVDEYTKMGVVTDIKQALRKCNALKINYSTRKASSE
ncbi:MAG: biopolymer transporter ExbD [Bacteroidales bacterium]|nr:biopolymer transporter ExbD [Bacteroidales bacterium]